MALPLLDLAMMFDDDELLEVLLEDTKDQSSYDPDWPRLNLDEMLDNQVTNNFRFQREDLPRLQMSLGIPEELVFSDRSTASGMEALCITLRRLAYPCRLCDLEPIFGRPKSVLSTIINETIQYLHDRWNHLLTNLNQPWMDYDHLQMYADAISDRQAPLQNCIGFVDGTVRPLCRPTYLQQEVYNGHKRVHSLKFQSVVLPNGLIANMYGPMSGRRHDSALLRMSDLLTKLQDLPEDVNGNAFCLYGDPAYPLRPQLLMPYRGAQVTAEQQEFNAAMSSVRESVEWIFGKIISEFAFLDYKKNLKLFLQPVATYYLVGAVLTNCHTCLYGSIVSDYFDLQPPTLDEYLVHGPPEL